MAYERRVRFTLTNDVEVRKEILKILSERHGVSKAQDILLYSKPLSKKRWNRWLELDEMDKFLEEYPETEPSKMGRPRKNKD